MRWEQLGERDQLLSTISDTGKDALGFRPRWHGNESTEELKATLAYYIAMVNRQCEEDIRRAQQEAQDARDDAKAREDALTPSRPWTMAPAFEALS